MSKFMPCCFLFLTAWSCSSQAQDKGHGRVTMNGQIVASACTIITEDVYQSIYLGTIPLKTLIVNGEGPIRKFKLQLVNCVLSNDPDGKQWRDVLVNFDGVTDESLLFATKGGSQGVGIRIMDSHQQTAEAGKPMKAVGLESETTSLSYQLQLVRNNQRLRSGDFFSTIRFVVYYQ